MSPVAANTEAAQTEAAQTEAARQLAVWLSPAYPVGGFAYSCGLEQAVADGGVAEPGSAVAWIGGLVRAGALRNDAILAAAAWRAPDDPAPAEAARALAAGRERLLETEAQGAAFAAVTAAALGLTAKPAPYPVAVGRSAAAIGASLPLTLTLFLQAGVGALVSALLRLAPLGQTDGQRVLADLAGEVRAAAAAAEAATLDDLGSGALAADLAALRHETLPVRLFRS